MRLNQRRGRRWRIACGAAALLNIYTWLLEGAGMSPWISAAIHATEYVLFAADMLCFLVYVGREVWLLLRTMSSSQDSA